MNPMCHMVCITLTCIFILCMFIPYTPKLGLTQQVLNGQIGSPKSFEFQEFFSQEKHRLRTLLFLKMLPYVPNFNSQKQKPAISVCGPRQLIVNDRRSSQNMKNVWCRFLTYKGSELYILKWKFYGEYFFLNSS